ncbi:MAG: PcfJ domain-containing protein, partial [Oscillospiraceae bacterium]|nr:PcfJ domain-containing protein [Oscillospiraceae bacterium]
NMKLHIMFIRTVEKPDVPFYTVEVDLFGKIVQVRGLRNCKTTPEVDAFMEEYKQHLAAVFGKEKRRKTA